MFEMDFNIDSDHFCTDQIIEANMKPFLITNILLYWFLVMFMNLGTGNRCEV